jgi:hypothetical protein
MATNSDFVVKHGLVVKANTTVPAKGNLQTSSIVRTTARPSLDINFSTSNILDPRIEFSRASAATYIATNGLMLNVGNNQPRFDCDVATGQNRGLLIEEVRTNLISISANPTPAALNSAVPNSFTISTEITPLNPTATVFKSVRDTSTSDNNVGYLGSAPVLSTSSVSVVSIWVYVPRVTTVTTISLSFEGQSYTTLEPFDTTKRDQWQRISTTCTSNTTTGIVSCLRPTGMVTGGYFYSTCWQMETGANPSSYIPTNGSQVTRSADRCSLYPGSWYNPIASTWYAEYQGGKESTQGYYGRVLSPSGSSTILSTDGGLTTNVGTWGGTNAVVLGTGADYWTTIGKSAMAYDNTTLTRSLSGRGYITTSSYTLSDGQNYIILPSMGIGQNSSSASNVLNGRIRRITYWPARLSDAQLQTLTVS